MSCCFASYPAGCYLSLWPQVGINPFAALQSSASGSSTFDKVIDLLVRASRNKWHISKHH